MTEWVAVCEADGCDWRSKPSEAHYRAVARSIEHRRDMAGPGAPEHESWVRRLDEVDG